MPWLRFTVDRRESGQTLAAVIKARYGLSWSQAKRLIARRHVRVGGQVETDAARRLKPGRTVELDAGVLPTRPDRPAPRHPQLAGDSNHQPPPVRSSPAPGSGHSPNTADHSTSSPPVLREGTAAGRTRPPTPDLEIVYVDDAVVVVNKPAGLTTCRTKSEAEEFGPRAKRYLPDTLADLLPAALGTPGRAVIPVHRLDRDTSGLVVFARTPAAAEHLSRQFRRHTIDRRYLALTRGVPTVGRVESVLVRDRGDGRRGSATGQPAAGGQRAVTYVRVLEPLGPFALVECRLETGRTHQVRIHLGEMGTPLCGERVYDRPLHGRPVPDGSGATRPMLHAARLGFRHPHGDEPVLWEVPPPADFTELLHRLRAQVRAGPTTDPDS